MNIIKRIFCKHNLKFIRNIYGDEIIALGYKRSAWICSKCGEVFYKDNLYKEEQK